MQEVVGAWSRECHVTGRAEREDGALETLGRDVKSEGLLGRKRRCVGVVDTSGVELGCGLVRKPTGSAMQVFVVCNCTRFDVSGGRSRLTDESVGEWWEWCGRGHVRKRFVFYVQLDAGGAVCR